MKTIKLVTGSLALLLLSAAARAEEKVKPPLIPLKVDVVFTEYEGEKKVSSLPYTMAVNANSRDNPFMRQFASIRMGVNVPVSADKDNQIHYEYVGTQIDGQAISTEDGRFRLNLNANRSSLYFPSSETEKKSIGYAGSVEERGAPMIRRFDTEVELVMRDGQTIENTMATDPITGHVWKVAVTLHVVK